MGFLTAPLYLFSDFFLGKATEHLIGAGIKTEHLNESRLGRVMDQIYEYGITLIFVKIATEMCKRFGVSVKNTHLDGTSMSVHGKYQTTKAEEEELVEEDSSEPVAIAITQGYSLLPSPRLEAIYMAFTDQ